MVATLKVRLQTSLRPLFPVFWYTPCTYYIYYTLSKNLICLSVFVCPIYAKNLTWCMTISFLSCSMQVNVDNNFFWKITFLFGFNRVFFLLPYSLFFSRFLRSHKTFSVILLIAVSLFASLLLQLRAKNDFYIFIIIKKFKSFLGRRSHSM